MHRKLSSILLTVLLVLSSFDVLLFAPNVYGLIATIRPNGNVSVALTPSTPPNWDCVDETPAVDTDYVSNAGAILQDLYTTPSSGVPAGSTINSVKVYGRAMKDGGIVCRYYAKVRALNQAITTGSAQALTTSWVLKSQTWTTNPVTTVAWTVDEVNDLDIGVALKGDITLEYGTYCSQVYAEINYTAGGGDTTAPTYSNVGTNTTIANQPCQFSVLWNDNVNVSGYIFGTNNTGAWVNDSAIVNNDWTPRLNSTAAWSNITKTLNSTVSIRVEWRVWCNDTSNNWNSTGIQYLITTSAKVWNSVATWTFVLVTRIWTSVSLWNFTLTARLWNSISTWDFSFLTRSWADVATWSFSLLTRTWTSIASWTFDLATMTWNSIATWLFTLRAPTWNDIATWTFQLFTLGWHTITTWFYILESTEFALTLAALSLIFNIFIIALSLHGKKLYVPFILGVLGLTLSITAFGLESYEIAVLGFAIGTSSLALIFIGKNRAKLEQS